MDSSEERRTFVGLLLIALVTACGGGEAAPVSSVTPSPNVTPTLLSAPQTVPMGVDHGLHHQCIRTTSPNIENFYSDDTDCPNNDGYPISNYWTTAATIANQPGLAACTGAVDPNQTAPINGSNSPVTESWQGSSAQGYAVELKVDYTNVTNICSNSYTWVPLMDNWLGGGPLPRADLLYQQFVAVFNRSESTSNGSARAFANVSIQYHGAGSAESIEAVVDVDFYWEPAWGRQSGLPQDVIASFTPGSNAWPFYYIMFDGSKLPWPASEPLGTSTAFNIDWGLILSHAVTEKLLPAPANGWGNASVLTTAADVGLEVHDTAVGVGGPMGDLVISNYRESQIISRPYATPKPN